MAIPQAYPRIRVVPVILKVLFKILKFYGLPSCTSSPSNSSQNCRRYHHSLRTRHTPLTGCQRDAQYITISSDSQVWMEQTDTNLPCRQARWIKFWKFESIAVADETDRRKCRASGNYGNLGPNSTSAPPWKWWRRFCRCSRSTGSSSPFLKFKI